MHAYWEGYMYILGRKPTHIQSCTRTVGKKYTQNNNDKMYQPRVMHDRNHIPLRPRSYTHDMDKRFKCTAASTGRISGLVLLADVAVGAGHESLLSHALDATVSLLPKFTSLVIHSASLGA